MSGWTAEALFTAGSLAVLGAAGAALLAWLAFVRPRLGLYAVLALAPTQFIFIPVHNFFVSPEDILVLAMAAGFMWRLFQGEHAGWIAIRLHVFIGVMLAGYLLGFVLLDHFSRTLIRLPMAVVPSILACELLRERKHFGRAIGALLLAGFLDAAYGVYFVLTDEPLHPTRFSGMMGVNFSAIVILTAAVAGFAWFARTRERVKLLVPGVLTLFGLATLSKMGILALIIAWTVVLSRIVSRSNRRWVACAAAVLIAVALAQDTVRDRVLTRARPEVQLDGVERTSTDVRVLILQTVWRALGEQPLLGIGYFNFERYSRTDPEILVSTGGVGYATHNTYLEVLVEGGLLAFLPFLLHFGSYAPGLGRAWYAVAREGDVIAGAMLAALIVVLFSATVANVLLHYLFWSLCGVVLSFVERLGPAPAHGRLPATGYSPVRP